MKLLLTLFVLCVSAGGARSADLLAVYQGALQKDPQLREAEAPRLAALEAKPQALAALLPQLSGSGNISREHDSGSQNTTQFVTVPPCVPTTPPGVPCSPPGTPATVAESFPFTGKVDTTTKRYSVDLKQSLFRWENGQVIKRADSQLAQADADD